MTPSRRSEDLIPARERNLEKVKRALTHRVLNPWFKIVALFFTSYLANICSYYGANFAPVKCFCWGEADFCKISLPAIAAPRRTCYKWSSSPVG